MRDALGGTVNVVIIVMFIVIALGYITFNIRYTKAFRVNDKIVSLYEQYKGNCLGNSSCAQQISQYAEDIGYARDNTSNFKCPAGFEKKQQLYCLKEVPVKRKKPDGAYVGETESKYFIIITKTRFTIPILNKLLDLEVFSVRGSTKTIVVK